MRMPDHQEQDLNFLENTQMAKQAAESKHVVIFFYFPANSCQAVNTEPQAEHLGACLGFTAAY